MIQVHAGTKIIIVFIAISVVWFFVLNLASVYYYEKSMEEVILDRAYAYSRLSTFDKGISLPDYLIIRKSPLKNDKLIALPQVSKDRFFYLKQSYLKDRLKRFGLLLFGLEASLFLSLTLFTYLIVARFIRDIESKERFMNLLLLSFNHKIGNFLSTQKINVEILKHKPDDRGAIARLENTCQRIENDMKRTFQMVKDGEVNVNEELDLRDIIEKLVEFFNVELRDKSMALDLNDMQIVSDPNEMEALFYNLIDNAVRYSRSYIQIRGRCKDDCVQIYIRNDIESMAYKGTGLGKEISEKITRKYSGRLRIREKSGDFFVYVRLPKTKAGRR